MLQSHVCPTIAFVLLLIAVTPAASQTLAFVDVNVVPMDTERVLRGQTVVVRDDRIVAVGPRDRTPPPPGSRIVDGGGRLWLSPGLADMHVHGTIPEDLALYVAHGVTTVLHMGDAPAYFLSHVRPAIAAGELVGPHMHFAMKVDGAASYGLFFVADADQARAVVRIARAAGYDFMKAYSQLTAAQFEAMADEARRQGLALIGHGVTSVGLPAGLFKGQVMVAHAEEFLYTAFANKADPDAVPPRSAVPAVAGEVRRAGAFVTPNLVAYEAIARQWGRPAVVESLLAEPEAAHLSPVVRLEWSEPRYGSRKGTIAPRLDFLRSLTRALADSGVPLLAGTDAPTIAGTAPGSSLHHELRNLTASGLTPFQALAAATRTAGEFIARTRPGATPFGRVAVGMRADLVLAEANPLDSLGTLRAPVGVLTSGRWFDRARLQTLLDERSERYRHLERLRSPVRREGHP